MPNVIADKEYPVLGIGFPVPTSGMMLQSMGDPNDLKNIGANSMSFLIDIPYYSSGELNDDCVDWLKDQTRSIIKKYKQAGFTVVVMPGPTKINPLDYSGGMYNPPDVMQAPPGIPPGVFPGGPPEGFPGGFPGGPPEGMPDIAREMTCALLTAGGEPGPISGPVDTILENYEPVVIELAQIAEDEGADVFTPMKEAEFIIGSEAKASKWNQDMLPKIKEVFSGKVLWRGDFHDVYKNDNKQIDFSGYDIIGFTILAGDPGFGNDNIKRAVTGDIAALTKWAEDDGVPEVWITEFDISNNSSQSEEEKAIAYELFFEAAENKLDGYQMVDIPYEGPNKQVGWPGTPLKDSLYEPIVREWFNKMAGPVQDTQVTQEAIEIPFWIRNNAGWWAQGQLSDNEFISGIQWLMWNEIIIIPAPELSTEPTNNEIPDWIKNNAGWWANGKIPDSAFISGIQWLISNGIMTIS